MAGKVSKLWSMLERYIVMINSIVLPAQLIKTRFEQIECMQELYVLLTMFH